MATYYVLAKSLWQGDTFSPVAGPFDNKADAVKMADDLADYSGNLKQEMRTVAVSKTRMKDVFGWSVERAEEELGRIAYEQMQAEERGRAKRL